MSMLDKAIRTGRVALGGAVIVALASCGGNDDGMPPPAATTSPTATIPASASASVTGFIAFLKILVVTQPDNLEPLDTTGFVAPTDDTIEPDPSI